MSTQNSRYELSNAELELGILSLCERFESAVNHKVLGNSDLSDQLLKQNAVFAFQQQIGMTPFEPALEKSPLAIFSAEIKAMSLMALLPEQEVRDIIPAELKTQDASDAFARRGAPALAKVYKP